MVPVPGGIPVIFTGTGMLGEIGINRTPKTGARNLLLHVPSGAVPRSIFQRSYVLVGLVFGMQVNNNLHPIFGPVVV